MNSRKIATIASLAALSIATDYAMVYFPNVKLMDLIVFVSGFCFGPAVGVLTGVVSWAIYGPLNPQGFSLPIWLATMFFEAVYGVAGAWLRKSLDLEGSDFSRDQVNFWVFFGLLGMLLTFVYDIGTNIVFGYAYGMSLLYAIVIGFVPFGIVHVLSNALFFGFGCVPSINALLKVVGGEKHGIPKK